MKYLLVFNFVSGHLSLGKQMLLLQVSPFAYCFQYMGQHLCKLAKKFDLLIHYVKTEKHMEAFHNMLTGKATCETTNENTLRYKVLSEDDNP